MLTPLCWKVCLPNKRSLLASSAISAPVRRGQHYSGEKLFFQDLRWNPIWRTYNINSKFLLVYRTRRFISNLGEPLTTSPIVKKVSFTCSTAAGKLLMKQSASMPKKLSFKLARNTPLIAFGDTDLNLAVTGAIASKFCSSARHAFAIIGYSSSPECTTPSLRNAPLRLKN